MAFADYIAGTPFADDLEALGEEDCIRLFAEGYEVMSDPNGGRPERDERVPASCND